METVKNAHKTGRPGRACARPRIDGNGWARQGLSQYRNGARGFNWAPLAEGGQRWPCPAPPGVVSRFHLEVLTALCLVIRPHLPAQYKRRKPGWTLPPKCSVGQFDSQPASVLCSSFPGQPPHPMSLKGRCIVLGTSQPALGAGQRAG